MFHEADDDDDEEEEGNKDNKDNKDEEGRTRTRRTRVQEEMTVEDEVVESVGNSPSRPVQHN